MMGEKASMPTLPVSGNCKNCYCCDGMVFSQMAGVSVNGCVQLDCWCELCVLANDGMHYSGLWWGSVA